MARVFLLPDCGGAGADTVTPLCNLQEKNRSLN